MPRFLQVDRGETNYLDIVLVAVTLNFIDYISDIIYSEVRAFNVTTVVEDSYQLPSGDVVSVSIESNGV